MESAIIEKWAVTDGACVLDCTICIDTRGLRMAKHPKCIRPPNQRRHPWVYAKMQQAVLRRIVKGDRLIEMRLSVRDFSSKQ